MACYKYVNCNNFFDYLETTTPKNYKLNNTSNTNFANLSNKMRLSQVLKLNGASQQTTRISRISGKIQFGNFYLGKPLNVNYLGRMEGMPGGSGMPPVNKYN